MISHCKKCKINWRHPVDECIYCRSKTEVLEPKTFRVKGITEVLVPSEEHKTVPYYSLLLVDEFNCHHIKKSYKKYSVGDTIEEDTKTDAETERLTIGIIGAGILGIDITKVMLQSGHKVLLNSRRDRSLERASKEVELYLLKNFDEDTTGKLMENLSLSTNIERLSNADFVLECIIEDLDIKKETLGIIEKVCKKGTVIATNTSSLSIDSLSENLENPKNFIGMHFFNPATKMNLVEVVQGDKSSERAMEKTINLVKSVNKIPIVVKDSPCFIANRILMPYLNEAVQALEEGIAKKEDIDTTAKLALNHPMGPLQLLDLIGLDVFLEIMNNLKKSTGDPKYEPRKLVRDMVSEGKIGRKSGEGFYKYKK